MDVDIHVDMNIKNLIITFAYLQLKVLREKMCFIDFFLAEIYVQLSYTLY